MTAAAAADLVTRLHADPDLRAGLLATDLGDAEVAAWLATQRADVSPAELAHALREHLGAELDDDALQGTSAGTDPGVQFVLKTGFGRHAL